MKPTSYHSLLAATVILPCALQGQTVTLYANQFITPNIPTTAAFCGVDLDITPVNTLWGGTGIGTGGGGLWANTFTVETIMLNGPGNVYTDPSGQGGDYCIGMLTSAEDDRSALTVDRDGLPYVNLVMNLSALEVSGCGGPFGVAVPKMRVVVFDSPGGVFNIFAPGTVLDEDTLIGIAPAADPFTTNWVTVGTGLNVSGATDDHVTVYFDLIQSGYAVFDDLEITASTSQLSVPSRLAAARMTISPNPVQEMLVVPGADRPVEWSILSVDGRLVTNGSGPLSGGVDVAALRPGVYVLQWSTGAGLASARFIKE